jgi:hypothetical protein
MTFTDTDDVRAVGCHDGIRVAPTAGTRWLSGDRPGSGAGIDSVHALIGEVRKVDHRIVHHVAKTAVFVDEGSSTEVLGKDIVHGTVGGSSHDDETSGFRGTTFDPVRTVLVVRRKAESNHIGDE